MAKKKSVTGFGRPPLWSVWARPCFHFHNTSSKFSFFAAPRKTLLCSYNNARETERLRNAIALQTQGNGNRGAPRVSWCPTCVTVYACVCIRLCARVPSVCPFRVACLHNVSVSPEYRVQRPSFSCLRLIRPCRSSHTETCTQPNWCMYKTPHLFVQALWLGGG